MKCQKCQSEIREGAAYCLECGERLLVTCPLCRKRLPLAAKFCDDCGANIGNGIAEEDGPNQIRKWIQSKLTAGKDEPKFKTCTELFERILIEEALQLAKGNRSATAKLLGLTRPTLHSKLQRFKMA